MMDKAIASRAPYWEEIDSATKIERLRDEVAQLCRMVTAQAETIAKLSTHQHSRDGVVLIRMDSDEPRHYHSRNVGIPYPLRKEHERH